MRTASNTAVGDELEERVEAIVACANDSGQTRHIAGVVHQHCLCGAPVAPGTPALLESDTGILCDCAVNQVTISNNNKKKKYLPLDPT